MEPHRSTQQQPPSLKMGIVISQGRKEVYVISVGRRKICRSKYCFKGNTTCKYGRVVFEKAEAMRKERLRVKLASQYMYYKEIVRRANH